MDEAIFERAGDAFVAGRLARGPWDPGHCHGGAPAALLAVHVDAVPSSVPMQGVRLTFDIQRSVPIGTPLTVTSVVARDGRRVQVVEAELTDPTGTPLVRCRALRIRTGEIALPDDVPTDEPPPTPGPDQLSRFAGNDGWEAHGFWTAVDLRFVEGALGRPGRGTAWFRVAAPLCDDLPLTPLAQAAAVADFGNGIGAPLALGPYRYVNPDLTVDLHRLPDGPWVGMRSYSIPQPTGIGLTTSSLFDRHGRIGAAAQSLYLDTRDSA